MTQENSMDVVELHKTDPLQVGRRLFLAGLVMAATGCRNFVERAQSPDNQILNFYDNKNDKTKYIGDETGIWGLEFSKVEGIGLAVNLDNTGSNPKPSGQRDYLVSELEIKSEAPKVEKLLASDTTELVLMKGLLRPGIRKGEHFDIEVRTLPKTDATSLKNGMILQTRMKPMAVLGRRVKQGHVIAMGKGGILVDALFETRKDQPNQLHGVVLGGGVALEDRELGLAVRDDFVENKTTTWMARAINDRFTMIDKTGHRGVAEPKTDRNIVLALPDRYRHNVGRYLQVVTNIAYAETGSDKLARIERLEKEMQEPATAGLAAVRLEALGSDGIPTLKRVLRNPDLEIKFYAAQALAYLGETDGVEHLIHVAKTEPAFRWHSLTALSSLDEPAAKSALSELMQVKSAETRYGAFRAMQARSPQDPLITGRWLGDFFLHSVPSASDPMLHYSRSNRPEIVVFGEDQTVGDDFLHVQSGLTVRATGNQTVSFINYLPDGSEERKSCSNRVSEVIEMLATSGFSYGDLLNLFRDAKNLGSLNSRLVVNAVPKLGRTYVPASDEELPPEKSERFVTTGVPELFRDGKQPQPTTTTSRRKKTFSSDPASNVEKKDTKWGKLKGWLSRDGDE